MEFNKLPVEIIRYIFLFASYVSLSFGRKIIHKKIFIPEITLVSKFWREVYFSTVKLNLIQIRCRNGLNTEFTNLKMVIGNSIPENINLDIRKLDIFLFTFNKIIYIQNYKFLTSIKLDVWRAQNNIRICNLPNLRKLKIKSTCNYFISNCPKLENLLISNRKYHSLETDFLKNIKKINLEYQLPDIQEPLEAEYVILRRLRLYHPFQYYFINPAKLKLDCCFGIYRLPETLTNLTNLEISGCLNLSLIMLPNLEKLKIVRSSCINFTFSKFPKLKKLVLFEVKKVFDLKKIIAPELEQIKMYKYVFRIPENHFPKLISGYFKS